MHAHRGDANACAKSIRAIFRLANALSREPDVVSQLVRVAAMQSGVRAVRKLTPRTVFSDADLLGFTQELDRFDAKSALKLALVGERVCGLLAYERPETLTELDPEAGESAEKLPTKETDLAFYLETMGSHVDVADMPWTSVLDASDRVKKRFYARLSKHQISRLFYVRAALLVPPSFVVAPAHAHAAINCDLLRIAVAVERYRRDEGQLPDGLEALKPRYLESIPNDLLSGEPLEYKLTENGFQIASPSVARFNYMRSADESEKVMGFEYPKAD